MCVQYSAAYLGSTVGKVGRKISVGTRGTLPGDVGRYLLSKMYFPPFPQVDYVRTFECKWPVALAANPLGAPGSLGAHTHTPKLPRHLTPLVNVCFAWSGKVHSTTEVPLHAPPQGKDRTQVDLSAQNVSHLAGCAQMVLCCAGPYQPRPERCRILVRTGGEAAFILHTWMVR